MYHAFVVCTRDNIQENRRGSNGFAQQVGATDWSVSFRLTRQSPRDRSVRPAPGADGLRRSVVEHGLDVVAVVVEHERAVVAGVVLLPLPGRTVVAVAARSG